MKGILRKKGSEICRFLISFPSQTMGVIILPMWVEFYKNRFSTFLWDFLCKQMNIYVKLRIFWDKAKFIWTNQVSHSFHWVLEPEERTICHSFLKSTRYITLECVLLSDYCFQLSNCTIGSDIQIYFSFYLGYL